MSTRCQCPTPQGASEPTLLEDELALIERMLGGDSLEHVTERVSEIYPLVQDLDIEVPSGSSIQHVYRCEPSRTDRNSTPPPMLSVM